MFRGLAFTLLIVCTVSCGFAQEGALKLKKVKDFVIYKDPNYYSAFPSLAMRDDGEILCAFRRAPDRKHLWNQPAYTHVDPNSYLVMVRSRDNGETWTTNPELIFAHPMGGSQDPCMALLKDGSIICTSYAWALLPPEVGKLKNPITHSGFGFLGGYVLRSDDGGSSWKGPFVPIHVPADLTYDVLGNPCPAFNRGQMIQRKDGKIYWAVCANKQGHHPRGASVHLLTSSDRGETWQYVCAIAQDDKVQFNETSLFETAKGDIIAFMRTDGFDGKLAYAHSTDGGKTFGQWQDGVIFGHPFQATRLKDGRVFLIYGYRKAPFGIRAKLLNPDCTDIVEAPELVIRDDGGGYDLGYPWSIQLPDGKILAAYYINIGEGTRHIAGSVIEVE